MRIIIICIVVSDTGIVFAKRGGRHLPSLPRLWSPIGER